ncbi:MAG: hypothetical protein MRQ13_05950, partial [Candidatus Midichloria sp.]|nr:hypothetical protein [Candidatus Midichloria sp.]
IQLNMANEIAVNAFLNSGLPFLKIPEIIEEVLNSISNLSIKTIEDVFAAAQGAGAKAAEVLLTKL